MAQFILRTGNTVFKTIFSFFLLSFDLNFIFWFLFFEKIREKDSINLCFNWRFKTNLSDKNIENNLNRKIVKKLLALTFRLLVGTEESPLVSSYQSFASTKLFQWIKILTKKYDKRNRFLYFWFWKDFYCFWSAIKLSKVFMI